MAKSALSAERCRQRHEVRPGHRSAAIGPDRRRGLVSTGRPERTAGRRPSQFGRATSAGPSSDGGQFRSALLAIPLQRSIHRAALSAAKRASHWCGWGTGRRSGRDDLFRKEFNRRCRRRFHDGWGSRRRSGRRRRRPDAFAGTNESWRNVGRRDSQGRRSVERPGPARRRQRRRSLALARCAARPE